MSSEQLTQSSDSSPSTPQFLRQKGPIAGVAAGVASDLGVDVTLVRIAWVVAVCIGFGFFLYPICWIAFPKASDPLRGNQNRILGVCNRAARRWNQPVGLVRLIAISLLFLSFGTVAFGYVIAHFILPASAEA